MKHFFSLAVLLLCLAGPTLAQDDETIVLPDAVMKQVVHRIVTFYFKPRRSASTIYFSDENIKTEWLPNIKNIRFVLLPRAEDHHGQNGYVITGLDRADDGYTIGFGYGEIGYVGGGYGVTWSFRVIGNKVRLRPTRGGFGWASDADAAPKHR